MTKKGSMTKYDALLSNPFDGLANDSEVLQAAVAEIKKARAAGVAVKVILVPEKPKAKKGKRK